MANMDLPKAILCKSFLGLLLLVTYVFVSCTSKPHNPSMTLNRINLTDKSGWLHHERVRRYSSFTGTCDDSRCTGNDTEYKTYFDCYCDEACYKIFSDCCPDYEKQCGRQKFLETKTTMWKCVSNYWSKSRIKEVNGVWMITKCAADWPFGELRTRCENAPSEFSYLVEDIIPVEGANSLTYRNQYCALCNRVKHYTPWDVHVSTNVTPPEDFDLNARLRFIKENGGSILPVPSRSQPRRYCYGRENYADNCSLTNTSYYEACVQGSIEVVGRGHYFKNRACAICNGYHGIDSFDGALNPAHTDYPEAFYMVFSLSRKATRIKKITKVLNECPRGTVYDPYLMFCRIISYIFRRGEKKNEFLILLWFTKSGEKTVNSSKLENELVSALISRLSLQDDQISQITFHKQSRNLRRNVPLVATFRLTLTPCQSLLVHNNQHRSILNYKNHNTAFLKLLNFKRSFTLSWKEICFFVIKVTSKRLSNYVYDKKKLQCEYEIKNKNESVGVNDTRKTFSPENCISVEEHDENESVNATQKAFTPFTPSVKKYTTLYPKLGFPNCRDGAFVPLRPAEYVIFPNLTVYHNATGSVFNFGEYLMSENKGTRNTSNITQNSLLSSDSMIIVCLPFKNTFNKTEIKYSTNTTSYALRTLTLIGFTVSSICLILLLITYGLFQQLRTVPGMNLMNLSLSMLLSHLIWLIGTSHFTGTKTCTVLAILEHYIFHVSFLAMSVISYHSCYVFSQPFAGRVANKSWRRFIKYSAFVWLAPAIFVAICVTLDKTETFLVDYGTNCWLGNVNAKLYLFLLPLAVLLLFNIVTFIRTALSLYRHDKERPQTFQRQERKQNLLICAKLATLVGFPWLIAFIGVLFPNVEAFQYLFVIFVCLQGLYIGMAFLFNRKTLKLYKDRWNIGSRGNAPSYTPAQTFEMT
ncbi:Cadherin EGF LAG seven-pass G-type receptor 1 [Paramuricea clavata]|uniref:Cadherin EGF LAG seven-pass G-type receptor 1 n=1 Tax=Paramuricea clavata TaxID=317549 RepID=A0A6S7I4K0_PARCT|nr:Cadherin EGF LAG seven-pass G-type receptor 1 [Paramuricea clavata]